MKTSTIFIIVLSLVIITVMYITNVSLKNEYHKIDLSDTFKNYVSVKSDSYSVLDISGSNGYPIEIIQNKNNDIKVLRTRLEHFKSNVKNDTLFIRFTGSNISMSQSFLTTTPSGIIIYKNNLSSIHITNTHNRISGYQHQDLNLSLKGYSHTELINTDLNTLALTMENQSQIEFLNENKVDSLSLKMTNESVANLEKIDFNKIHPVLSDSITLVLSKDVFQRILKN